ncbi:MAG: SpoIIE family protein phosphatase [Phycisphaerae bacterium]|nr:SpoIIE family protein phosphatase [Phycisphaerae bacterium]
MTADPNQQIMQLRRLLDVTRQMAATTDLSQLLGTIVDAARAVLNCERATIFLYDRATNELFSRVATGVESIRFPADRGIAGAAAQQRVVVNVPEAYADSRFNPEIDRQTGFRTRNLLTFPLENLDGELMGVLQALNRAGGPFDAADEELARVLSAQAGVALHRYVLLEQYAEKQRMARDLELARKIQQALFPATNPSLPGYDIAGWNRPTDETGGDCYDFMPLGDGRLAFLLADATGHGIGAALVIAQCRSLVRAMLTVTQDLVAVATRVNQLLAHDLLDGRFVTAVVGVLDPRCHRLDYVSAGQGPLLFISPTGVEVRGAGGLPLAIMNDCEFAAEHFDFAPGAAVVLLTDGFYETLDAAGAEYGEERVAAFLARCGDVPLEGLIQGLHAEVRRFRAGAPQADDLTALLIRRQR